LKVVVFNKSDFDWAKQHAETVPDDCLLYLQPEWSKREAIQPLMVEFVKQNTQWQIGLQTHKYLGVE
jgi:organic radical activating enzyme